MSAQTFKSSTICHAFKEAGSVPLNPKIVIAKRQHKQTQLQTAFHTPFSSLLSLNQRTSQSLDLVIKYGQKLQQALIVGLFAYVPLS